MTCTSMNMSHDGNLPREGTFRPPKWGLAVIAVLGLASICVVVVSIQKENASAGYLFLSLLLPILLAVWNRSIRLSFDREGIVYKTLFKSRKMSWHEIAELNISSKQADIFLRNIILTIHSGDPKQKDISFNIRIFSRQDLVLMMNIIFARTKDIKFNALTAKLLETNFKDL